MNEEKVILVDDKDQELGLMEKMQAHREGALHRAISVFIFNSKGEWLLQKRAAGKYHSAGLWSNSCCSHPRKGEPLQQAAQRRLKEEMGLSCELKHRFSFIYKASLDAGLTEHELDHVFIGTSNDLPYPEPSEVAAFRYISAEQLQKELLASPDNFSAWFKLLFDRVNKL